MNTKLYFFLSSELEHCTSKKKGLYFEQEFSSIKQKQFSHCKFVVQKTRNSQVEYLLNTVFISSQKKFDLVSASLYICIQSKKLYNFGNKF